MKAIIWIVINAAFAWCAWAGFHDGIRWAENVFKFGAWVNFGLTIFGFIAAAISEDAAKKLQSAMPVPMGVNLAYGISLSMILSAFGHFGYATIIFIQGFLRAGLYKDGGKP